jgi:hypothetical protein
MEERGPWWRVFVAILGAAAIISLSYVAFRQGGFAFAFDSLKAYFEAQGVDPADSGNVAAGALQTAADLNILVGVLYLFGFVDRGFKKHAQRRQAGHAILAAYEAFIHALLAVRATEKGNDRIKYGPFLASRLAGLRRAIDELSARPYFYADILPESGSDAMEKARDGLLHFYAFIENVTAWGSLDGAAARKDFFVGSRDEAEAASVVSNFHRDMETFLLSAYPTARSRRKLREDLGTAMREIARSASRFVTVERQKDPVSAA